VPKSEIHLRPKRLADAIESHLSSIAAIGGAAHGPRLEIERFRVDHSEGTPEVAPDRIGVERLTDATGIARGPGAAAGGTPEPGKDQDRRAA
jgi:hypothetical protein